MNNYLLRIETYGIKNIKNKITIDFNKETIKLIEESNKSIKSIFGLNGSGKSALMCSIYFYKKILLKNNMLSNDSDVDTLKQLINKELNRFYFKVIFMNVEDSKKIVYSHEIVVSLYDEDLHIERDQMDIIKGQTINSSEKDPIYIIYNGILVFGDDNEINNIVREKTLNLLNKSTLLSILGTRPIYDSLNPIVNNNGDDTNSIFYHALALQELVENMFVYLDGDDDVESTGNLLLSSKDGKNKNTIHINITSYEDKVLKSDYDNYLKQLNKQTNFIKIFKPALLNIVPVTKEDNEFFRIRKEFDYGTYRVDSEIESTGIKKLMNIFNYIEAAFDGKIIFIDEMDANINGVFLDKLLEYFIEKGKGSLCFTSHNYESMTILKKQKGALLFLGETGKLVSLPKNGNSNPLNYYKEGMVEDSPFNFETYDFTKIFKCEEL